MFYKMEQELPNEECLSGDQIMVLIENQKLWFKTSIWLKIYIRAKIYNTPNLRAVTDYLIAIPSEAYDLFSKYYDIRIAENIKDLLLDFINAAMGVIDVMKYGDDVMINSRIIKWYQSADRMASYLASINGYWDEDQWKEYLYQYINITLDEINSIINDNYEEEMKLYNMLEDVNFLMAQYMAKGIILSKLQSNRDQE